MSERMETLTFLFVFFCEVDSLQLICQNLLLLKHSYCAENAVSDNDDYRIALL